MNEPQNVNNYDGPVFNAGVSGAQFAWNNETATQNQQNNRAVAPGFEELAKLVTDLLRQLPQAGLTDQDREDADSAARRSSRQSPSRNLLRQAGSAARLPRSREHSLRSRPASWLVRRPERRSGLGRRSRA